MLFCSKLYKCFCIVPSVQLFSDSIIAVAHSFNVKFDEPTRMHILTDGSVVLSGIEDDRTGKFRLKRYNPHSGREVYASTMKSTVYGVNEVQLAGRSSLALSFG